MPRYTELVSGLSFPHSNADKKWNISHLKVMQNENKEGESVKTTSGIYIISGANIKMEHQTENMYRNNLDIL